VRHAVRGDDERDEIENLQVLVREVPERDLDLGKHGQGEKRQEQKQPPVSHGLERPAAAPAGDVQKDERQQADARRLDEETKCRKGHGEEMQV